MLINVKYSKSPIKLQLNAFFIFTFECYPIISSIILGIEKSTTIKLYIQFLIIQILSMRPKSAAKQYKRSQTSPKKNKQQYSQGYVSSSKISGSRVSNSYSRVKNNWEIKTQKLNICTNAKNIALIHAYQPRKLKKCLVANPKSYKKFYNDYGGCSIANLYTKSFLAHFKQWRKGIRERLSDIVSMIVQNQKPIDAQQVKKILIQLEGIIQQLKQATQIVLQAKDSQSSSGQARNLHENFQHMAEYIKHLTVMIKYLCNYIKEIDELLEQGSQQDEQNIKQMQKKVKKIHKQYERKIMESLHYCTSHPQSSFMNKAEYKMKIKFDTIAKEAIRTLEDISKLRYLIIYFEKKVDSLNRNRIKPQEYSVDSLQEIVSVLNTNEEVKLGKKNELLDDENVNKSQLVVLRLQGQINRLITQFLQKFKQKSLLILKNEYKQIKALKIAHILNSQADRYKTSKKKLLLLTKIFTKSNYPSYYQILSTCIKETSQNFQNISQIIQKLIAKSGQKKFQHRVNICKIIQSIIYYVSQYEKNQEKICNNLHKIYQGTTIQENQNRSSFKIEDGQKNLKESEKLRRFIEIMHFSQNQTEELLSVPKYINKNKETIIKKEDIEKLVQSNIQQLYRLAHEIFPKAEENSNQLKKYLNDELIQKFVIFSDDILKEPVHSFWIFKQFYNKLYGNEASQKKITKAALINILQYFQQNMLKLKLYRNATGGKNFLQWMFENRVSMYILNSMTKLEQIFNEPINKQYWSRAQKMKRNKLSYRMNVEVREYIANQLELFKEIVQSSSKYVREKSLFDYYFHQCLQTLEDFIQKQRIFELYDESVTTGLYRPSPNMLNEWLNWEFNYSIDEIVSQKAIKNMRTMTKGILIRYVSNLSNLIGDENQQKILGNKFVQQCNRNISDIRNILIPAASPEISQQKTNTKGVNKIESYGTIAKSILTYLRNSNIYHIGLCADNEEPLTFLFEGDPNNFEGFLSLLQKKLGLTRGTIERDESQNRFKPIEMKQVIRNILQSNTPFNFILQQPPVNKSSQKISIKKPSTGGMFILDASNEVGEQMVQELQQNPKEEIVDQIYNQANSEFQQQIGQQSTIKNKKQKQVGFIMDEKTSKSPSKSKNKQSNYNQDPVFILPDPMIANSNEEVGQYESLPQYRSFVYYKLSQLESLASIYQCLKNAKVEVQLIKKNLHIAYLVLAFQTKQPHPLLMNHLDQVLKPKAENNFMEMLNKNNKFSKNRLLIDKLRQSLTLTGNPQQNNLKKMQALKQVFAMLDYSYRYAYNEGENGNKIILCQVGQSGHYAHAILENENPMKKYSQSIKDKQLTQIQTLFLKSLLTIPYEKNQYLDEIREQIKFANKEIQKVYTDLRDSLQVYRQYPVKNNNQMDKKIDKYINSKTNGLLKFSDLTTIDYNSYKKFMKEYNEIIMMFTGVKPCNAYINNNPQFPIFAAKEYQQIKNTLQISIQNEDSFFAILPSKFNTNSYVERCSVDTATIKYKQISDKIIGQLNKFQKLEPGQILGILYENNQNYSLDKNWTQKLQKINDLLGGSNDKDYRAVANLGKTIGEESNILSKLDQLAGQKELLEKIVKIEGQNACFVLSDPRVEIQKENQFMVSSEESQSFILEKPLPKPEIQSYNLQQLHKALKKAEIPHRCIRYKGNIIGLTQLDLPADVALIRSLNLSQIQKIQFSQDSNKDIQVSKLYIQVILSHRILEMFESKSNQKQILKILDNFTIEINTQNSIQTINNLSKLITQPVAIICKYPRRSIQIKLKRKNKDREDGSKSSDILSFIVKNYYYGSRYILTAFEQELVKQLIGEDQRLQKIQEERIRLEEQRRRKQQEQCMRKEQERKQKQLEQKIKKQKLLLEEQERKEAQNMKVHFILGDHNIAQSGETSGNKINSRKKSLQISEVYTEGDTPQAINFMELRKFDQNTDDSLSNQSIVLSQNAQIDRNALLQINSDFKFSDIKEIIDHALMLKTRANK